MLTTDTIDLHLQNEQIPLTVTNDNVINAGPLVVVGYAVRGSVFSEGEPILGVKFLLFPEMKTEVRKVSAVITKSSYSKLYLSTCCVLQLLKCDKKLKPSDGYAAGKDGQPNCYVESDATGKFEILALTPGNYKIVSLD